MYLVFYQDKSSDLDESENRNLISCKFKEFEKEKVGKLLFFIIPKYCLFYI